MADSSDSVSTEAHGHGNVLDSYAGDEQEAVEAAPREVSGDESQSQSLGGAEAAAAGPPMADQAEPAQPAEAGAPIADAPMVDVPWDVLFPKRNRYRDTLVAHALPHLVPLLQDPAHRLTPPRTLVDLALTACDAQGNRFWGTYGQAYTRKRSAADAILCHYFAELQSFLAQRL